MDYQLQGRKRGMTQIFDDEGNAIPCTVIEIEENVISQIKTYEKDGYNALQIAFEKIICKDPRTIEKRVAKPQRGHFARSQIEPRRFLSESRLNDVSPYQVGQTLGVSAFSVGDYVDIVGTSKGRGYQGTMKLHGFAGFPASHGAGPIHRHAGSTGQRSTPGRCFPGGKRASRMGADRVTIQSLKVMAVEAEQKLLVVKGAVPGARNGLVKVALSVKKPRMAKK